MEKFTSRKFWLCAALIIFAAAAMFTDYTDFEGATAFIGIIMGSYLAINQAAKQNGGQKP